MTDYADIPDRPRVPIMDDLTDKWNEEFLLLLQPTVMTQIYNHERDLQRVYIQCLPMNKTYKNALSWKKVEDQKLSIPLRCFLKMCRVSKIIPQLLTVETLQDIFMKIIPP